ncbi:MAG: hypothetical protein IJD96_07030 [Lachnospiraceae bacterium]|nr:hypothetical protein [Lachnospiraceae bacterium]
MNYQKVTHFINRHLPTRFRRQFKDRLFRFLFEKDKEALLSLYNALNGTDYKDASLLKIVTIENAVYLEMKNDLAFVVTGVLNMYEHQSTYNPNMPVRFLMYLAQEYHKTIDQAEDSLYSSRQIPLPTPQCVVFYNGTKEMPEEHTLYLSDAFQNKSVPSSVELRVKMLNINYGHNVQLMKQCKLLSEYSQFIEITRNYMSQCNNLKIALNTAIDYCIEHDILNQQLRLYRAEVLDIMLELFDKKKYERSLKREAREEGYLEGLEKGIKVFILHCSKQNIEEDQLLAQLEDNFQLTRVQAQEYVDKYFK